MRRPTEKGFNLSLGIAADTSAMAQARALSRRIADRTADALRTLIVTACALALIAAREALPF
jgi:hypothetical protein